MLSRISNSDNSQYYAIKNIFLTLFLISDKSFIHSLYSSIHMLSLSLVYVINLFFLFKKRQNFVNQEMFLLSKFFSLGVFALSLFMESWSPNYLLLFILQIILLSINFSGLKISNNSLVFNSFNKLIVNNNFQIVFALCTILSLPLFHTLKLYLTDDYFNHHASYNLSNSIYTNYDYLFITTPQLIPIFADKIMLNFQDNNKSPKVHWYFPVNDNPGTRSLELMKSTLKENDKKHNNALWLALKEHLKLLPETNSGCLTLTGKNNFAHFEDVSIIFEDRDNIFFTSPKVIIKNNSCYAN